ncbi:hypothetical protein Q7C36_010752 [Tachysurus vachellii]|uniref:Uncharacterized protein n=1 Tax=Tachysurus vachellii TaxID=175792 RepID=A0AA88SRS6_TACVA|nr:hypothetical protein Q7C36_010752 [Tachysurus vachellii]
MLTSTAKGICADPDLEGCPLRPPPQAPPQTNNNQPPAVTLLWLLHPTNGQFTLQQDITADVHKGLQFLETQTWRAARSDRHLRHPRRRTITNHQLLHCCGFYTQPTDSLLSSRILQQTCTKDCSSQSVFKTLVDPDLEGCPLRPPPQAPPQTNNNQPPAVTLLRLLHPTSGQFTLQQDITADVHKGLQFLEVMQKLMQWQRQQQSYLSRNKT